MFKWELMQKCLDALKQRKNQGKFGDSEKSSPVIQQAIFLHF